MRQISTTAFLGMLALTITGCPSSDTQQSSPAPSPSTTPVVVSTPFPVKPPLVASNPSSATNLAPGLIQPTNANQRAKQVAKGNRDPFAALFLPVPAPPISTGNSPNASVQTSQEGSSPRNVTSRQAKPDVTINVNNPRTASGSRTAPKQNNSRNGTTTSIQNIPLPPNTTLPNNNLEPALPPALPEPDLAKSVMVMGVIQIGDQAQAIVQVPSEATSRYVQVGQTLSNGQVLVKRIELNAGAEPLVVLEQYGVEVSKAVGETPSQAQQTTPTAAVPYLPPQNVNTTSVKLPAPPPNMNTPQANISLPTLSSPNVPVAAK